MHVIASAFSQCIAAISRRCEGLSLLHMLSVFHYESAAGQVRVMAELAIPVIDGDVVSKRMMPMVLLQAQIVRVRDAGFHGHHAASPARRNIESVQAVAP